MRNWGDYLYRADGVMPSTFILLPIFTIYNTMLDIAGLDAVTNDAEEEEVRANLLKLAKMYAMDNVPDDGLPEMTEAMRKELQELINAYMCADAPDAVEFYTNYNKIPLTFGIARYMDIITDKEYSGALTSKINDFAYVDLQETIKKEEEAGRIYRIAGKYEKRTKDGGREPYNASLDLLRRLDTNLYNVLFTMARQSNPMLVRKCGIDRKLLEKSIGTRIYDQRKTRFDDDGRPITSKPDKWRDIEADFNELSHFHGYIGNDGKHYALLNYAGYQDDMYILEFPYLANLLPLLEQKKQLNNGRPYINAMIYADIVKERDKIAIEITKRIVTLIQQGSQQTDNGRAIRQHIAYDTIIKDLPLLSESLANINGQRPDHDRNRLFQTAFTHALEMMRTKTDLFERYTDLQIYAIDPDTRKHIQAYDRYGKQVMTGTGRNEHNIIIPTYKKRDGESINISHKGLKERQKPDPEAAAPEDGSAPSHP